MTLWPANSVVTSSAVVYLVKLSYGAHDAQSVHMWQQSVYSVLYNYSYHTFDNSARGSGKESCLPWEYKHQHYNDINYSMLYKLTCMLCL